MWPKTIFGQPGRLHVIGKKYNCLKVGSPTYMIVLVTPHTHTFQEEMVSFQTID